MNYLLKATPTDELRRLSADARDDLMVGERRVAAALIAEGVIVWMWRLPDTQVSVSVWNAESADALNSHLRELPLFPFNDVEITALSAHPAFPAPLSGSAAGGRARVDG